MSLPDHPSLLACLGLISMVVTVTREHLTPVSRSVSVAMFSFRSGSGLEVVQAVPAIVKMNHRKKASLASSKKRSSEALYIYKC